MKHSPLGCTRERKPDCTPLFSLVFTDVVGSTALLYEVGDDAYDDAMRQHFAQAQREIQSYGGLVIDTAGDGFFVAFHTASSATNYAKSIWCNSGHPLIKIRAGVHRGHAKLRGHNMCGQAVHFASRIMGHAKGPEVWLSNATKSRLEQIGEAGLVKDAQLVEGVSLKDIPGKHRLWCLCR